MKNFNRNSILAVLLILGIGSIYSNCSMSFKIFGGSEPLSAEHRDMAIEIFELYQEELQEGISIIEPFISNTDNFFNREQVISYQDYIDDLNEDINQTIDDLNAGNIWYYVANESNVGASNYGGTPTIRESRFDELEIEMLASGLSLSEMLSDYRVKGIFNDLLHEVDHSITPRGHAPEFSASSNQFISTENMTRTEELEHFFDGLDFTYYIERGFTETLIYFWIVMRHYSENYCYNLCVSNVESIIDFYLHEDLEWFGIESSSFTSLSEEYCQIREIPRDANEGLVCGRHPAVIEGLTPGCSCGEVRISDLFNKNILVLIDKNISSLSVNDFLYLNNLTGLYLGRNELTSIPGNLFSHLTNLNKLTLDRNKINSLTPNSFNGLGHLVELNLSQNEITLLSQRIFSGLGKLEVLELPSNNISELHRDVFSDLPALKVLNLSINNISTIEAGAFNGLENLEELNLTGNRLSQLPSEWYTGLVNIKTIKLISNQFSAEEKSQITAELLSVFPNLNLVF